jgi:hypothetical protein
MKAKKLCFSCTFWKNEIKTRSPDSHIINGAYYLIKEYKDDNYSFQEYEDISYSFQEYEDSNFTYVLTNDQKVIRSKKVLLSNYIPDIFRKELPDTSFFITHSIYRKIKSLAYFKCQMKGCWDRHYCFWFDEELKKHKEWNKIPKKHKPGGEGCVDFINKKDIYG